jgi:hypothetical protein
MERLRAPDRRHLVAGDFREHRSVVAGIDERRSAAPADRGGRCRRGRRGLRPTATRRASRTLRGPRTAGTPTAPAAGAAGAGWSDRRRRLGA